MNPKELDALVGRVKSGTMGEGDEQAVEAMAETIKVLHSAVEKKSSSIKRLLRMLFGSTTEKTTRVVNDREQPPAMPLHRRRRRAKANRSRRAMGVTVRPSTPGPNG